MPKDHHGKRKAHQPGHCGNEPQIRYRWTDGQTGRIPIAPRGPWDITKSLIGKGKPTKKAFLLESLSLVYTQRVPQPDSNPKDRNPTQRYKDKKAFGLLGPKGLFLIVPPFHRKMKLELPRKFPWDQVYLKADIPVMSAPVIKRWMSCVPS